MKKYILILLFFTAFLQAQTLQNPTFGNTTTNTLKIKTPATVTSVNFLSTNEADGSISKIEPINVNIPYTPSNYSISNQSIGQHLTGIDTRLGQISSTTAGITQRVYFTADNTTVTAGTFFTSSLTGKGSTATGSPPALVLADNTKGYFTKDVISVAFPAATIGYAGSYTGQLTVSATPTPVATQQRFTIEIYRTDNGGTPIASGVSGAPTGDLGVTVVAILDSGILNLAAGSITNIPVTGILTQNITLNTGERLRYHVSAAKIGAGGGNVTFGVYYGSSYNSYYDVPVAITTDAVINKSTISGLTSTDALNNLDASILHKTGNLNETANGNKNFTGTTRFGSASGDNQLLWQLPGLNDMLYKETGGLDYDFNIGSNNPNSFFWKNNEGVVHQAFYFGDGSATTNIWGISASEDSGVTWQNSITANAGGKIGINNNNPRYNLDTYGTNRTRGIISSDTEISISPTSWDITYTSPDLALTLEQGYTSDGVYNYQFGTSRIAKYNFDYSILVADNTTPFSSIPGVDHIGDGCYLNGLIYAPVDNQSLTPIVTNEKIAVYNAATLAFVTTYDISAQNVEGASICTDGNILYLFSYYSDGTKIWKYSTTGTFLGTITVATPVTFVQGASYYKGLFYVSDQENLYTITLDGLTTKQIKVAPNAPLTHRAQGLEVINGEVRWTVLKTGSTAYNTYFLNPFIGSAPSFKADSSGKVQATAIGIGVSPSNGFHIKGADSASSKIVSERTSGAIGRYSMGIQNGDNQFGINDDAQGNLTRFVISKDGNVGIGYFTVTDPILTGNKLSVNGTGYFNGTVRIANGVSSSDAATVGQLNAAIPSGIKRYKALISQSGTSAPTAIVLENSLGSAVTWNRTGIGIYTANTTGGVLTVDKTIILNSATAQGFIQTTQSSSNSISLNTSDITGTQSDGKLAKITVVIEVYP